MRQSKQLQSMTIILHTTHSRRCKMEYFCQNPYGTWRPNSTLLGLAGIRHDFVGRLIWSLSNSTNAQGTLLDLHWPQNGPPNGPWEANFWGPLVKKGPAGSHHGPKWSILIDRSPDNGQTWVYRPVWGPTDARLWSNREFLTVDDNCDY